MTRSVPCQLVRSGDAIDIDRSAVRKLPARELVDRTPTTVNGPPVTSRVRVDVEAPVLTIALADTTNRNALGSALVTELNAVLDWAEADNTVRVIVVTNEGNVFSAGADLSERTSGRPIPPAGDMATLFRRILSSPKPFVGRIAGHAIAGGTGLAAAMDISVAREDAKFGFTEVRLGLAPAIVSVICLPKMRRAEAAAAFLRGRRFDGAEAARLGLITRAVPDAALDTTVQGIVDDVLAGGPNALAVVKQLMTTIPQMDVEEAFTWAAKLSADLFASPEGQEGMRAYLDKRPPSWTTGQD